MTLKEYEQLFKKSMISSLNWDRAYIEEWKVEQRVISDRKELGKIYLPWSTKGVTGDKGERLRLDKIGAKIECVGKEWRQKIFKFASEFEMNLKQFVSVFQLLGEKLDRFYWIVLIRLRH